jgi:hypothetical protein
MARVLIAHDHAVVRAACKPPRTTIDSGLFVLSEWGA